MSADRPPSPNEAIKSNSQFLRGTIADGLTRVETGSLSDDDQQLTKFHGIYVQDDRDLRAERGRKKMEKAFIFMARLRVPGGVLTPQQWLAAERVACERGNATLRLTTRQTIQFHGIIKSNLRHAIRGLNDAMLDTIAACGDVNRNVIARVNPWQSRAHADVAGLAQAIGTHLLPKSRAWHEIWIDGEKITGGEEEDEPIYGRTYMPRKFKIAVALPPHNDVDVFAHDLGYIAIEEAGRIVGYNVVVGGGMGMTHGEPDTFPRTGDVIGFCSPDQAVDVAEKVVTVQRDFGDRSDRKHARLKYTIERMGLDAFRAELEQRLGHKLAPARDFAFTDNGDRLGWAQGDDGAWHYTLFVENGRVRDLAGLHAIAELGIGRFIITPNQNLVLADIPSDRKAEIAALLRTHGLDAPVGGLRRNALACVALPTCGLALAESERYLPDLLTLPGRRTGARGPRGGRHHHPHDRLSERLRAAVPGRDRSRGAQSRSLQSLPRRRVRRRAHEQAVSARCRRRCHRRRTGAAVPRLRRTPRTGRTVRRLRDPRRPHSPDDRRQHIPRRSRP